LEAAANLLESGMQIRFELLGGPLFGQEAYAERLKQFAASSGLSEHVHFQGFVSDVPARIRAWDLLVHASTAPDPCPNVVLEAMAAGVPVVAADGGGVPELLEGGACGMLFPMDDSRALSQCIESALLDKPRRDRCALLARERAERYFRSERVGKEVASVWTPLLRLGPYERRAWPWIENQIPAQYGSLPARSGKRGTEHSKPSQPIPHTV
jgi:glycosyltransferase involved in cell wall biosynthesis